MIGVGIRTVTVPRDYRYLKFYRTRFACTMAVWQLANPTKPMPREWFEDAFGDGMECHARWVAYNEMLGYRDVPEPTRRSNESKKFYASKSWRALRFDALRKGGGRCCLCGRGAGEGVILHVDHIKPRSRYPHLSLDPNNLQVLCADCNLGKMNRSEDDWRTA